MVISTVLSRGDVEILHINVIHPEKKAVCMVDKVIVTASSFVQIENNFRELVQGNTVSLNGLFDEFRGAKQNFFFFCGATDIILCEYTLGNGPQCGCNERQKKTY